LSYEVYIELYVYTQTTKQTNTSPLQILFKGQD
jgi:hypothetical protein